MVMQLVARLSRTFSHWTTYQGTDQAEPQPRVCLPTGLLFYLQPRAFLDYP